MYLLSTFSDSCLCDLRFNLDHDWLLTEEVKSKKRTQHELVTNISNGMFAAFYSTIGTLKTKYK